jgi:CDGSH-type Zn-finger protein
MSDPVVPQKAPYAVEVEAGKDYFWCSCGKSASQPFCDGSHKGTGFVPLKFTPQKSGTVHLCGCKHSNRPPYCDGTHSKL